MSERVFITGLGPVTAGGVGCEALWSVLRGGKVSVPTRSLVVDLGRTAELPLLSMPPADRIAGLDRHLSFLAGQDSPGYRDLAYGLLAIESALRDAGLDGRQDGARAGLVQAFEAPGVERTVATLFEMMGSMPAAMTAGPPPVYEFLAPFFYNMQPFVYVHLAGKAFELRGFSTSVHNACTSGAFAIEIAAERIRQGDADLMLVAGGEAFDTGVRLEWFRRLDLYAKDAKAMRPFDVESGGFYVGEGAGAIVLESELHARRRDARVYAEYLGGSFAHQAWKQTVPDIRAARLAGAIESALAQAEVSPRDIDLIVPHGAATPISDGYESECLSRALISNGRGGSPESVVTAFKPYVGHMLAASGLIDTICGILSMSHGIVPATLNSDSSRARLPFPLATTPLERPLRTMLKLSTGFTGHDAALLFRRP